MKTNTCIIIVSLIFIISCSSNTEPHNSAKLIVTDNLYFSYENEFLDTLNILDIDFAYDYHFEGSNGQLIEYSYIIRSIETKSSSRNGWRLIFNKPRRGSTLKFSQDNVINTLRYSKLINLADQDTFYKVFEFKLKGFFCDSTFWNAEDTLDLESFEYSFIDTILAIP